MSSDTSSTPISSGPAASGVTSVLVTDICTIRYDADGSQTLNEESELVNLITNLCFKLKLKNSGDYVNNLKEGLQKGTVPTFMDEDTFSEWFIGFLGTHCQHLETVASPVPGETTLTNLRVRAATWNVGNKQPSKKQFDLFAAGGDDYDVIAIGAQECTYSTKEEASQEGRTIHGVEQSGLHNFFGIVCEHAGAEYGIVGIEELLEMRLIVLAKASLANRITNITHTKEATGLAGVVGNKGKGPRQLHWIYL